MIIELVWRDYRNGFRNETWLADLLLTIILKLRITEMDRNDNYLIYTDVKKNVYVICLRYDVFC